jgi:hypothetical protein
MKASAIVAEHGTMTTEYIVDQLSDALGDRVAVGDWRRIAKAVDAITDAMPQ